MSTYGSAGGVEALVQAWNGTANPTAAEAAAWLAQGYARINRALGNAGYIAPADASASVYDELTALNNLYAAAYVLRSQAIDTSSGESEQRSEVWLRDFYSQLADLVASNLTLVGLSLLTSSTSTRRRRLRTVQMRRVDGYSGNPPRFVTSDQDYAQWVEQASQGEYTSPTMPTE